MFTLLIIAMGQTGCQKKAAPPDELSRRATNALRQVCEKAARIEPAPSVRAVVENEGNQDGKHFVGVRFEVSSGTEVIRDLTFGSAGVGTSAADARTNAGEDWLALFADPYCAARAAAHGGIRVGGVVAYPSALGLRGEHPGGWLTDAGARNQRVLDAAAASLAPRRPGELGLLDIKVAVQDGERPGGECRINGSIDSAACERICSLPWPAGSYMYKQAFVYRAAPP